MKNLIVISLILVSSIFTASAQTRVAAKNAEKYIGQKVTICDKVYSAKVENGTTLLYLGGDFPKQLLTVMIKDGAQSKGKLEIDFKGKDICVTGVVLNDKGKPWIAVSDPKQIKELLMDNPVKSKQGF